MEVLGWVSFTIEIGLMELLNRGVSMDLHFLVITNWISSRMCEAAIIDSERTMNTLRGPLQRRKKKSGTLYTKSSS
jgi:hypothetical protein